MSTVTYRHDNAFSFKRNGVKHVIKENIIDGEKGLSFHFLKKVGDKEFFSITVRQTEEDKFSVRTKKGEKQEDSDVNMVGLMKLIKANKDLDFVNQFLTKERGSYKGRRRRKSKKSKRKSKRKSRRKSKRKSKRK